MSQSIIIHNFHPCKFHAWILRYKCAEIKLFKHSWLYCYMLVFIFNAALIGWWNVFLITTSPKGIKEKKSFSLVHARALNPRAEENPRMQKCSASASAAGIAGIILSSERNGLPAHWSKWSVIQGWEWQVLHVSQGQNVPMLNALQWRSLFPSWVWLEQPRSAWTSTQRGKSCSQVKFYVDYEETHTLYVQTHKQLPCKQSHGTVVQTSSPRPQAWRLARGLNISKHAILRERGRDRRTGGQRVNKRVPKRKRQRDWQKGKLDWKKNPPKAES